MSKKFEYETKEIITGIETDFMYRTINGDLGGLTLKITTTYNNENTSFVISYEKGKSLKLGDTIKITRKLI